MAAVRYFHLAHGKCDFTLCEARVKTLLKGAGKRESPNAKRPFNVELLTWMQKRVKDDPNASVERNTLLTSAVLGFFYLLRVSEIAQVRRSDITIGETPKGKRMILVIRQSKTEQAGAGITRALVEKKSNLRPVRFMESFLKLTI